MNNNDSNIAISFYIEEIEKIEKKENQLDIDLLLNEFEETSLNDDLIITQILNYNANYTVKELLIICEYYGFAKDMKSNKFNKYQIIDYLVKFENNAINSEIVFKRQNMWFYINELKNDKFMKKFILL